MSNAMFWLGTCTSLEATASCYIIRETTSRVVFTDKTDWWFTRDKIPANPNLLTVQDLEYYSIAGHGTNTTRYNVTHDRI